MNLTEIRQSIGHLKTRVFGLAPAEQQYGRQEMEELATAICEYGRMRQQHYGSRSVLLGAGELAMRLRETNQTIVKALGVLRDQGGAEEIGTHGRWRLHFNMLEEQAPDRAVQSSAKTPKLTNYIAKQLLESRQIRLLPSELVFLLSREISVSPVALGRFSLHRASASAHKVKNQDHQCYHEKEMDQTTANVKTEAQKPQNSQNHKDSPKHTFLLN
jgi:hypothetical protein